MPSFESFEIENSNNCSICLEDLGRFNLWKCKQCNTKFHKKCIIKWKKANPHYPEYFECRICKLQYDNKCYWWYKYKKKDPYLFFYLYIFGSILLAVLLITGIFLNLFLVLYYLT